MDAMPGSGDQALTFVGLAAFSVVAGELCRRINASEGVSIVDVDASADFRIELTVLHALTADDCFL
jgi:hypothetical protein